MEELLLINPAKRPSKRRKSRTPAQKRATAKMLAANRSRYKSNPSKATRTVKRRRKNKTSHVAGYYPNPRRRASVSRKVAHRRYKRNPSARVSGAMSLMKDSAMGAVGAIAVEALFGFLPLPATWKSGHMMQVAKSATALAVGLFGHKILPRGMAGKMAVGSLTVTMHEALKPLIASSLPGLHLGYYPGGMTMSDYPAMNGAPAPALSEYINQGMHGLDSMAGVDEYVGNAY